METTHEIGTAYYPTLGEAEIIIRDVESGEEITLLFPISKDSGDKLCEVIPCCVYAGAIAKMHRRMKHE